MMVSGSLEKVRVDGMFFRVGSQKWYLKGLTYGPFAPNSSGHHLPESDQMQRDFAHMRQLGANAIRLYFPPSLELLELALENNLRVLIDVPWEKHRCFFEDWNATNAAREAVRDVARQFGTHPAVFAISVVNEFPNDVVRYYGHRRLELFVDDLLDIVHQEAPNCLATFANFPTTEFLQPKNQDFHCFNVYLHDPEKLGGYLDRLQHLTGALPLVLGEFGVDSFRNSEHEQSEQLVNHVHRVFRHGLAGSFVFSYTDDWYTGGHQIEDWAFGITRRDRAEKPVATALNKAWEVAPSLLENTTLPKVSVVVCSYNGARTLEECLSSLMCLNYPDYEVILVNDGSTDATSEIAKRFPLVRYIEQENRGLSYARNVGARAASGEIVAYTDDDCVADVDWLTYLTRAMDDQRVDAIGGPNITPLTDGWTARCVSVSPGNPSHVMLDDRRAEHVPGCNMAYRREVLLEIGGFDTQYRTAGDDVDLCWRLLDQGKEIGFAPSALVWHHRRCTVKAYLKQQKGYGRAEAMVQFKHPQRFSEYGQPIFHGVIYGDGAVGLPILPPRIYHGRYGSAPFQTIYRQKIYSAWAWTTSLEWHALAVVFVLFGFLNPGFWIAAGLMELCTLGNAIRYGIQADLPKGAPFWCRPLVMYLHAVQPVIRSWHRWSYRIRHKCLPKCDEDISFQTQKRISNTVRDLYWENGAGVGRENLLAELELEAESQGWHGDFKLDWAQWDLELLGDIWHSIRISTVTEELGWPRRYTRARCTLCLTTLSKITIGLLVSWTLLAVLVGQWWAVGIGLVAALVFSGVIRMSCRRCLKATSQLLALAAVKAGLQPRPEIAPAKDMVPENTISPVFFDAGSTTAMDGVTIHNAPNHNRT